MNCLMHWQVQQAKETISIYNIPETTSITNVDGPMDGCWHDFYHCILEHI